MARLDMCQVLDQCESMLASGTPHLVATVDSSAIVMAQKDCALLDLYHRADLCTADSNGVVWAMRRRGATEQTRVSGVDLMDRLVELSSRKGYRIFLLGSEPGIAELAAERLRLRHPGCPIVGTRHGYFPAEDDDLVAQEIAEHRPDILFVAMGIPRQEKFIMATRNLIRSKVAVGVGGSFDVFSGKAKRAPRIVQSMQAEWLWRLLLNPRKVGKCAMLPKFAWAVLRSSK